MVSLKKILNKILESKANEPVLLWENASPRSEFSSQRINMNLSSYNFVEVIYSLDGGVTQIIERCKYGKVVMVEQFINPTYQSGILQYLSREG